MVEHCTVQDPGFEVGVRLLPGYTVDIYLAHGLLSSDSRRQQQAAWIDPTCAVTRLPVVAEKHTGARPKVTPQPTHSAG